jgi:arabinose-5-phosphate isomerase
MLAVLCRVVVTGMGKAANIHGRFAATSCRVDRRHHVRSPQEASHGDLGMIKTGDVVLAISNSGESGS